MSKLKAAVVTTKRKIMLAILSNRGRALGKWQQGHECRFYAAMEIFQSLDKSQQRKIGGRVQSKMSKQDGSTHSQVLGPLALAEAAVRKPSFRG